MRRTALITGGSRGLGLALPRRLAADGWNLVVDGRDADALERARREVDAAGPGTVIALPGDIADPVHVAALVNAAAGQGGFELLVSNAGTLGPSPCPMSPGSGPATSSGSCGPTSSHRCGSSRPPSPTCGRRGARSST